MQADACIRQPLTDRLQAFEGRGIHQVDRRAYQHQILQFRLLGYQVHHGFFEKTGVGEIQAFIHPQKGHFRAKLHIMAQHITEMLGARHTADHRTVWAARPVQEQADRQSHARDNAGLNTVYQG